MSAVLSSLLSWKWFHSSRFYNYSRNLVELPTDAWLWQMLTSPPPTPAQDAVFLSCGRSVADMYLLGVSSRGEQRGFVVLVFQSCTIIKHEGKPTIRRRWAKTPKCQFRFHKHELKKRLLSSGRACKCAHPNTAAFQHPHQPEHNCKNTYYAKSCWIQCRNTTMFQQISDKMLRKK